ncbi:MAG TPA: hypothetical protein VLB45_02190 [Nitrosopumilaceae archaeon]|nr:hypothetical protein [Nitrosopumilaceae archaeon]
MIWPGMGDPAKRKQTIKFLIITAAVAAGAYFASFAVTGSLSANDPLKQCINNRDINYKISATFELIVDGIKVEIPANVGNSDECKKSLYTISNDGVIYAEWDEKYDFEIGHFLWIYKFPLREMDESKSKIFVNDIQSPDFVHAKLENGYHYRGEFVSKAADTSKEHDFLPPES